MVTGGEGGIEPHLKGDSPSDAFIVRFRRPQTKEVFQRLVLGLIHGAQ